MSASRITSNRVKKATAGEMLKAQNNQPQHRMQQQQVQQPIPKLSISDAIALITLRLGKVESILERTNDTEEQYLTNYDDVFEDIINRLDKIEKNEVNPNSFDEITKLREDFNRLKDDLDTFKTLVVKLQTITMETNTKISQIQTFQQLQQMQQQQHQPQQNHLALDYIPQNIEL
jgi:hypothetical protein